MNVIDRPLSAMPYSGSASRSGFLSGSSVALSNLRAVVIVIVLAFHSMLAYLAWAPAAPAAFDAAPYVWRLFPIIDSHHFFAFDLFCAWQDVYLMSLMFFLSGLFVWSSLERKKHWAFLRDRVLRLGVPFAFGIAVLIPIAVFPAYLVTADDPSVTGYWHAWLALPFWTNGPLWFLWQLLALNILVVGLHVLAPKTIGALGRRSAAAEASPGRYFVVLVAASALAYVPLALAFTPWAWSASGLLALQFCRPLHYAVYFFAGVGIGASRIERGLLRTNGVLSRHWARWLAAALASLFLWMGLTGLTLNGHASVPVQIADDLSYAVACAAGCFFLLAVSLRFATRHSRILDSLSLNAYGLYLVHYDFVVWLQYALLGTALYAVVKATLVFGCTLALSWIVVLAVQRIPLGARLIGVPRRAVATS
jgi:glucans biosynthesis protein C